MYVYRYIVLLITNIDVHLCTVTINNNFIECCVFR